MTLFSALLVSAAALVEFSAIQDIQDLSKVAPLLELVCPGEVVVSRDGARVQVGCNSCPDWSAAKGAKRPLVLKNAYSGNFSGAGTEVFLGFEGCGTDPSDGAHFAMVRAKDKTWEFGDAGPGDVRKCVKVSEANRDLLVCEQSVDTRGVVKGRFVAADVVGGKAAYTPLLDFQDSTGACMYEGQFSSKVEPIFLEDVNLDLRPDLVLISNITTGRYMEPRQEKDACTALDRGTVAVSHRRDAHVFSRSKSGWTKLKVSADDLKRAPLRDWVKAPTDFDVSVGQRALGLAGDVVDRAINVDVRSEAAWPMYERRILAAVNAMDKAALAALTTGAQSVYPKRAKWFQQQREKATQALVHKVPLEWREKIPVGDFSKDERLFLAEIEALGLIKKDPARAEAIYLELIRQVSDPDARATFELGLGKVLEARGEFEEARLYYQRMLLEAKTPARRARIMNRLGWFLLTTEAQQDLVRGRELAEQATVLTEGNDPSVLDTLAEAAIREGRKADAAQLLKVCVTLDPERGYYQQRLKSVE